MAPTAQAPAAIEDIRCAVVFMINNAKHYNVTIDRIILMGGSAGGHLAMLAAFAGHKSKFDKNCPGTDIKILAVINSYGIADMNTLINLKKSSSVKMWLKEKINDPNYLAEISPINYINKNTPPVFIVHGDADPIVEYNQSVELKKKLDTAGVYNVFITVPGGGHGKFPKEERDKVSEAMWKFIRHLGL